MLQLMPSDNFHYHSCKKYIDQVMLQKSISKKSSRNTNERCDICYRDYDLSKNKPLLICRSNHCICKVCLIAIREKPHCPFCRQFISFKEIRLNCVVLHKINQKMNRETSGADPAQPAIQQALQKGESESEGQQQEDVFLDQSEFGDAHNAEQQVQQGTFGDCSLFLVLMYVYFVLLQLPLGTLNIHAGCNMQQNHCRLVSTDEAYQELALSYKTLGGAQIFLGLNFLYLRYLFKMGKIGHLGQLLFNVILSFFVILKCVLSIIIFIKFLHQKNLSLCLSGTGHHMLLNLFLNYFTILLGVNIQLRLCCLLQIHH